MDQQEATNVVKPIVKIRMIEQRYLECPICNEELLLNPSPVLDLISRVCSCSRWYLQENELQETVWVRFESLSKVKK